MDDALKRLDRLTQEEARVAAAEVLKVAHIMDDKITTVINGMSSLAVSIQILCSVLIRWPVVDDVKCLLSILSCLEWYL